MIILILILNEFFQIGFLFSNIFISSFLSAEVKSYANCITLIFPYQKY